MCERLTIVLLVYCPVHVVQVTWPCHMTLLGHICAQRDETVPGDPRSSKCNLAKCFRLLMIVLGCLSLLVFRMFFAATVLGPLKHRASMLRCRGRRPSPRFGPFEAEEVGMAFTCRKGQKAKSLPGG